MSRNDTPQKVTAVPTATSGSTPLALAARRCHATTKAGTPCGSRPLLDSDFCLSHDPTQCEAKRAACQRGGIVSHQRKMMPPGSVAPQLESAEDIRHLISDTIHRLSTGEMDRAIANGERGCVFPPTACHRAIGAVPTLVPSVVRTPPRWVSREP